MVSKEILALEQDMIAWRRWMHRHAELSFEEKNTTQFLEKTLRSFGITDLERPTETGLVAKIHGTKKGKPAAVGIRADIDALPIQEDNDLPFRSEHDGVMHACGHDGHAAMLLAAAKVMQEHREEICGEVRLLFQHAEELPPGGAIEMVRAGAAEGLDAVLGLHLSSVFPTGQFGLRAGALTANTDRFDITILGRGGHCAYPEQCIDVVTTGAQLILALQTLVSRRVSANSPTVLSVCRVEAGNAYNILPNAMTITGTTRCFGPEARSFLRTEMERITKGVAQSAGAEYEFSWQEGYPSVMNDEALTALAQNVLENRFGKAQTFVIEPLMPGEDYPYFLENGRRPGFFVELGTRNEAIGCDKPHHNPGYRMDESALKYGAQYFVDMIAALLDGERSHL